MVGATTAPRSGRLHRIDLKSSKRVLSSGDYFYFCNRKNKLVGGRIHILWIDYDPKSILKFLVFWDTERQWVNTAAWGARGSWIPKIKISSF